MNQLRSHTDLTCRVFGPWREGAIQQVETGLNLTVVLTSDGQCFQMGETGASGRVKWEGCKEPELVRLLTRSACHLLTATLQWVSGSAGLQVIPDSLLQGGFCQA